MNPYLIIGLGNPGEKYDSTRHNIGFRALDFFAHKMGWVFHKKRMKKGWIAKGVHKEKEVILLKPTTYMNLSGQALKCILKEQSLSNEQLLVVVDDADLPFGTVRLKQKGSSGGHNGLKSIESTLQSQHYQRLKIGIGRDPFMNLEDFVLGSFSKEEELQMPQVMEKAIQLIELWLEKGVLSAMNQGNQKEVGEKKE